jgi:S-DNA-T family DNA segregation ATPase FtsK/SpoIIIE
VVGIEIPNAVRETVYLKGIVDSEPFRTSDSKLTLALGNDISGDPFVIDLAKMPHLLVAGSTGSGKSVSINSMICSILLRAS